MPPRTTRDPLGKITPLDYVFMIGGPVLCLAIILLGVRWALGPAPPDNPVSRLKQGVVKPGMTKDQVLDELGRQPQSVESRPDGGVNWVYHRGTEEPFVEEDAVIAFSAGETVVSVSFERSRAPVTGSETTP